MLEWVYYIVTTASLTQAATNLFVWRRTGNGSTLWFSAPAFLLVAAAAAMTQISIGDAPLVPRANIVIYIRLSYLAASCLWMADQAFYVRRFLRIEHK